MKNIINILLLMLISQTAFSQIRSNNTLSAVISGQSAFLDASASTFSNSVNNGKGLVFPRTNLTTFTFNPANGNFVNYPTGFDGFILYNTTTGATPATGSGVGSQAVTPGFYFFSNPGSTGSTAAGQWVRLDGGQSRTEITNNSITETINVINGVPEKVIRVIGSTNGTSTEMNLGTPAALPANTVVQFRKAIVYDSTGKLLLTATSDYNTATNVFVTGDGMVNKLLPPASNYVVELYFLDTAPVAP